MVPQSAILSCRRVGSAASCAPRSVGARVRGGFTLIELILVMALLTVAVAFTAPALARFFGGRTLDSEARRLLALTRHGQGRAASEGLTVDLWLDAERGKFGLEVERSFDTRDPRKEQFELDSMLRLEVSTQNLVISSNRVSQTGLTAQAAVLKRAPVHAELPTIRFLPDGTIGEDSPQALCLKDHEGAVIWIGLSKNRMNYEIRSKEEL